MIYKDFFCVAYLPGILLKALCHAGLARVATAFQQSYPQKDGMSGQPTLKPFAWQRWGTPIPVQWRANDMPNWHHSRMDQALQAIKNIANRASPHASRPRSPAPASHLEHAAPTMRPPSTQATRHSLPHGSARHNTYTQAHRPQGAFF